MKPAGDIVKSQKTVQGFTGAAKSAAKASTRPQSGTRQSVVITLYTADTLLDLKDMNTGNPEVVLPRCEFNTYMFNFPQ